MVWQGSVPWLHRSLNSFDLGTEATLCTDLDFRKNISNWPENAGHPAAREPAYQGLCRHDLTQFGRDRIGFRLQRGTDVARQPTPNVAKPPLNRCFVERMTGIEPAYSAWEALRS